MSSEIQSIEKQDIMLYLQLLENVIKILNINYMHVDKNKLLKISDDLLLLMRESQTNAMGKSETNVVVIPNETNGIDLPSQSYVDDFAIKKDPALAEINISEAVQMPQDTPSDKAQTNSAITKGEFPSSCGVFITKLRDALNLLRELYTMDPIAEFKEFFKKYKDVPSIINNNIKEIEKSNVLETLFTRHEYDSIYQVSRSMAKLFARLHEMKDDDEMSREINIKIMENVSIIIPPIELLLFFCFQKNINPTIETNNTAKETSQFLKNGISETETLNYEIGNITNTAALSDNLESTSNDSVNPTKEVNHGYYIEANNDLTNLKQDILKIASNCQETDAHGNLSSVIGSNDDGNKSRIDSITKRGIELANNDISSRLNNNSEEEEEVIESNTFNASNAGEVEECDTDKDSEINYEMASLFDFFSNLKNKHKNLNSSSKAATDDEVTSPVEILISKTIKVPQKQAKANDVARPCGNINLNNDKSASNATAIDVARPCGNNNLSKEKSAAKSIANDVAKPCDSIKLNSVDRALKRQANDDKTSHSYNNKLNFIKSASKQASQAVILRLSDKDKHNDVENALKDEEIIRGKWFKITRENYFFRTVTFVFSRIVVDKYIAYHPLAWNMIIKVGSKCFYCCCCNIPLQSVLERDNHLRSDGHASCLCDVELWKSSYNLLRPCKSPNFYHCGVCNIQYNNIFHLTNAAHKSKFEKARNFVRTRFDSL